MPLLDIQISVEDEGWPEEAQLVELTDRVIAASIDYLKISEGQPFPAQTVEISIVFTNDGAIREINARWRGKDKETNVLSFPAYPVQPGAMPGPMLGDIVVARETIEREAAELDKDIHAHLTHLLVHGLLHLFGYDHLEDDEAEQMEALETRILAALGLSDPYAGHDSIT